MSGDRNDGGPAFPTESVSQNQATGETTVHQSFGGMSLRDYFIAHAPEQPQPWFEPAMPPKPVYPIFPAGWSAEQKGEYNSWRNGGRDLDDIERPEVRSHVECVINVQTEADAWDVALQRERYLQWPAAWADAMLKARAAS